jgi:hypothetical protein
MSGGMAITLLDGVDQWPQLPAEYADAGNGLISSELQKKGKTHPVS